MRRLVRWAIAGLLLAAFGPAAAGAVAAGPALRIGMEIDAHTRDYFERQFGGGACPRIGAHAYANPDNPSRVQGELLILCNALRLGGYEAPIAFVHVENYNRALADAAAGRIDVPVQSAWESDLAAYGDALLPTAPVIRAGEWVVGLFTVETRADVLGVRDAEGVRGLVGAAPRGWVEDWRALEALGLKGLIDVQDNGLINPMIVRGRADITLNHFKRGPDLGYRDSDLGLRALPIPGLKVAFDAARRFAVSATRPDAAAVVAAIDAGLDALRRRGDVARIMEEVGLFNPRVADWTVIDLSARGNN